MHGKIGSGEMTTRSVELSGFDSVETHGFLDLELLQGEKSEVLIRCDDNLQEDIVSRVDDRILILDTKPGVNFQTNGDCRAKVTLPILQSASSFGSGNIQATNFTGEVIRLRSSGSGDIQFNAQATELRVVTRGSGDAVLSGIASKLEIQSSGSGDIDAQNLMAQIVHASTKGSGDLKFTALREVQASSHGSGDIKIWGQPKVRDTRSHGSGDIEFE